MTDREKLAMQVWLQRRWERAIKAKQKAIDSTSSTLKENFQYEAAFAKGYRDCCADVIFLLSDGPYPDALDEVTHWTKEVEEKYGMELE